MFVTVGFNWVSQGGLRVFSNPARRGSRALYQTLRTYFLCRAIEFLILFPGLYELVQLFRVARIHLLEHCLPEPCKLLGFHQVNALVVRFDRRIFLLDLQEPLVRGREPWFEGGFIDPLPAPNAGRTASAVMAQMPERVFCN